MRKLRILASILVLIGMSCLFGCGKKAEGNRMSEYDPLYISEYTLLLPRGLANVVQPYDKLFSSWYTKRIEGVGASQLNAEWAAQLADTPVYYVGDNDVFIKTSKMLVVVKNKTDELVDISMTWGDLPDLQFKKRGTMQLMEDGGRKIAVTLQTKDSVMTDKVKYNGYLARIGSHTIFYGCVDNALSDDFMEFAVDNFSITSNNRKSTPLDSHGVDTLYAVSRGILKEKAKIDDLHLAGAFLPEEYLLETINTSSGVSYSLPSDLFDGGVDYDLACYTCRLFDNFACEITSKYHKTLAELIESDGTSDDKSALSSWQEAEMAWQKERGTQFASNLDKNLYSKMYMGTLSASDKLKNASNKVLFAKNKLKNVKEDFKAYWLNSSYLSKRDKTKLESCYTSCFDTFISPYLKSMRADLLYGQLGEYLNSVKFKNVSFDKYRDLGTDYKVYLSDSRFVFVTTSGIKSSDALDWAFVKPDTSILKFLDFDTLLNKTEADATKELNKNCDIYSPFRCLWNVVDNVNYAIEANWALRYFRGASTGIAKQVEGTLEPVNFELSNGKRTVVNALTKTVYDTTISLKNRVSGDIVKYYGKLVVAMKQDGASFLFWDSYANKADINEACLNYEMNCVATAEGEEASSKKEVSSIVR